jgi:hypothetical protein
MKKTTFLISILCTVYIVSASAQEALTYASKPHKTETKSSPNSLPVFDFAGYSYDYELAKITVEMSGEHALGDVIAKKVYLLDEKYKSEVALIPGNPQTKTVIQKPILYNAVKRIEKHLKKSVKKGETSIDSATYLYNKVLDVALSLKNADTKAFENAISSAEDEAAKIELFTKRVNLTY